MRMLYYFVAGVACAIPALLWTAWLGIQGARERHLLAGLVTAILVVGVHTLLILFMLVTGRVLREGMRTRNLPADFLVELNAFFAKRQAYPAAVFGAVSIVAAGVLGQAGRALGLHPAVHMLAGLAALVLNLWAFSLEVLSLRANQRLLDRAAVELDAIDRELAARGTPLRFDDPPPDARKVARGALILALSAWLPYLYWVLIVWRGDFAAVSLHPWIEVSAAALLVWFFARKSPKAAAA